jgi:hypothetical protein
VVVKVTFNPKDLHVKFDMSDPSLHLSTAKEEERHAFAAALAASPGTPTPSSAGPEDPGAAVEEVSAAVDRLSASTTDLTDTIAAIGRARASGDLAEVERLKADFQRRSTRQAAAARAAAGGPSSADATDPLERLSRLADLHDRGALTDAEFAAQKAKVLGEG